jgi:hypothetical protein
MDIRSFNKKLNKITALTDQNNDEVQLSPLERDLLLSYIRELYDIALDGAPARRENMPTQTKFDHLPIETKSQAPVVVAKPVVEVEKSILQEEIKLEVVPPKIEVSTVIPEVIKEVKPEVKPINIPAAGSAQSNVSEDLLSELFVEEKVSELSDKLGQAPIKDLTKAMGINERIFTQQELFNNSATQFNDILNNLNNMTNFADAKAYIISEIIPVYGWTHENKIKKAATFIKLVKRKYI